jgi:hypothetical protein
MNTLKPTVGLPESILTYRGRIPMNVYIIARGEVVTLNKQGEEDLKFSSGVVGNFFGRNKTVKCATFCDLFALDLDSYNAVAAFGKDARDQVEIALLDPSARAYFLRFGRAVHSAENIEFLLFVKEFISICERQPPKIATMAQEVYDAFISPNSDNQVNLPAKVSKKLKLAMKEVRKGGFVCTSQHVFLHFDSNFSHSPSPPHCVGWNL